MPGFSLVRSEVDVAGMGAAKTAEPQMALIKTETSVNAERFMVSILYERHAKIKANSSITVPFRSIQERAGISNFLGIS